MSDESVILAIAETALAACRPFLAAQGVGFGELHFRLESYNGHGAYVGVRALTYGGARSVMNGEWTSAASRLDVLVWLGDDPTMAQWCSPPDGAAGGADAGAGAGGAGR